MGERASEFVVCLWGETAFSGEAGYLAVGLLQDAAGGTDVSFGTTSRLTRLRFPSRELTTASSYELMYLLPTTLCTRDSLV